MGDESILKSDRLLPPHNVEAEESILGGILLDPEAIERVADLVEPEAFYLQAHQDIYRAALTLHSQAKPTDLVTIATWLQDRNLLDKAGGMANLVQLANRTVTAVNIDEYGKLIREKYQRRQLIKAGNEIVDLGYDTATELESILDRCEQKIFQVAQERSQEGLTPIVDSLIQTYNEIENLQQETQLPGIRSGFYDLDAMTSGFQRSDLVILAGRPSMGKTALGLNIAAEIAKGMGQPVAIFSLEMSKEQLTQRLLSSEAKIPSNTLRSGNISQAQTEPLLEAIGRLSELPIFIDDGANTSALQMRSQARRLKAQYGELGLVLLDYLQLMEGSGSDNRVQELSRITRSLKIMARELKVPVIALSQLSRSVEQRNNKRPMLSDLRESGCLSGESWVTLTTGKYRIRDLVGQTPVSVLALDEQTGRTTEAIATRAFVSGIKPVFRLQLSGDGAPRPRSDRAIRATANHSFLSARGWQRLESLRVGDRLAVPGVGGRELPDAKAIAWEPIEAIAPDGMEEVYDLSVPHYHNFIANEIVVHNSIEQDADLVVMLYRDAYYNPDTPDRDIAEAIITKHRNGPTGTVKLLFNPELTEFRNLARQQAY